MLLDPRVLCVSTLPPLDTNNTERPCPSKETCTYTFADIQGSFVEVQKGSVRTERIPRVIVLFGGHVGIFRGYETLLRTFGAFRLILRANTNERQEQGEYLPKICGISF